MRITGRTPRIIAKTLAIALVMGGVVLASNFSIVAQAETSFIDDITAYEDLVEIEDEDVALAETVATPSSKTVTTVAVCATAAVSATGLYVGLSSAAGAVGIAALIAASKKRVAEGFANFKNLIVDNLF